MYEVQWRISGANDGNGTRGHTSTVECSEPAAVTERLQRTYNTWPRLGTVSLHVDPKIERLSGESIEDAVVSWTRDIAGVGILAFQDFEDRLYIQRIKCTGRSQGADFMSNLDGYVSG